MNLLFTLRDILLAESWTRNYRLRDPFFHFFFSIHYWKYILREKKSAWLGKGGELWWQMNKDKRKFTCTIQILEIYIWLCSLEEDDRRVFTVDMYAQCKSTSKWGYIMSIVLTLVKWGRLQIYWPKCFRGFFLFCPYPSQLCTNSIQKPNVNSQVSEFGCPATQYLAKESTYWLADNKTLKKKNLKSFVAFL